MGRRINTSHRSFFHQVFGLALVLALVLAGCSPVEQIPQSTALPTPTPVPQSTATAGATRTPLPDATATPPAAPEPTPARPVVEGVAGERTIGDPYAPELGNTGYDVQRYTLRLALDPARMYVDSYVTIEALATLENLAQISLDFIGYEVEEVSLDGTPAVFLREGNKLVVDLPAPLAEGQAFVLDVIYQGEPEIESSQFVPFLPNLGLQFSRPGDTTPIVFAVSEPDGARYWYPSNDHPRDKAAFRFELSVPEGLTGAANGVLVETRQGVPAVFEDGSPGDVYIWEHAGPMATYLATVVVGEHERIEDVSPAGVPLRHYVLPDRAAAFAQESQNTGEMVDWMSDLFGGYPFEVFGFAHAGETGVSLETQTLVILDVNADEYVMAHELAHMWFGDWVSLDTWGDMWRNEGFATYFGWMWLTRNQPAGFDRLLQEQAQRYENYVPPYPLNQPPPRQLFGNDSYVRGALLVHALRQEMGDDAFFEGLREYFVLYGGGTATHEQFQAVMEAAAGIDLDAFFEEWFQSVEEGAPPVRG